MEHHGLQFIACLGRVEKDRVSERSTVGEPPFLSGLDWTRLRPQLEANPGVASINGFGWFWWILERRSGQASDKTCTKTGEQNTPTAQGTGVALEGLLGHKDLTDSTPVKEHGSSWGRPSTEGSATPWLFPPRCLGAWQNAM